MPFNPNEVGEQLAPKQEMQKSTENREASVGVPQGDQQPAVSYSQEAPPPVAKIEVPHSPEQPVHQEQDNLREQVESILADKKIMDIYAKLPESKKRPFKEIGEDLAKDISEAIRTHKVKPYKILAGVRKWLSIIPDIEKYYLLQEAKIDVDQVLALAEEQYSPNAM